MTIGILLLVFLIQLIALCMGTSAARNYVYEYETCVKLFNSSSVTGELLVTYKANLMVTSYQADQIFKLQVVGVDTFNKNLFQADMQTVDAIVQNEFYFVFRSTSSFLHLDRIEQETQGSIMFKKSIWHLFNFENEHKKLNFQHQDQEEDSGETSFGGLRVHRQIESDYFLLDLLTIQNVTSIETVKVYSNLYKDAYQRLQTYKILRLVSTEEIDSTIEPSLAAAYEPNVNNESNEELKEIITRHKLEINDDELNSTRLESEIDRVLRSLKRSKKLKYGTSKASRSFATLIRLLRNYEQIETNSETLVSRLMNYILLTNNNNDANTNKNNKKAIESTNNLNKILVDVLLNAQTELSKALLNTTLSSTHLSNQNLVQHVLKSIQLRYNDDDDKDDDDEMLLTTLIDQLEKVDSYDLSMKVMLAIGSLKMTTNKTMEKYTALVNSLRNDCQAHFNKQNHTYQFIKYSNSLHECKLLYLESAMSSSNAQLKEELMSGELAICAHNYTQTCLSLLRSSIKLDYANLQQLAFDNFIDKKRIETAFVNETVDVNQVEIENRIEIRIEAFNVILNTLSTNTNDVLLENMLRSVNEDDNVQFTSYCKRSIFNKMKTSSSFRQSIFRLFTKLNFDFYSFIGQLDDSIFTNSQSENDLWQINGDQSLKYKTRHQATLDDHLTYFQFGLKLNDGDVDFVDLKLNAKKMDKLSFVGGNSLKKKPQISLDDEYKCDDAELDIELSLLGRKLVKTRLFRGYADMLKRVWGLPSKSTSIFQANVLLNDQNDLITLSNGMVVQMQSLVALSFDLSFMNELSVWNQYAKSYARATFSISADQKFTLYNDFMPLHVHEAKFDASKVSFDLMLNTNFANSPYKFCTLITNRKFNVNYEYKKSVNRLGNKLQMTKRISRQYTHKPFSYLISRDAIKAC